MDNESVEQKLQAMRDRFGEGLAERLTDIEQSWTGACAGDHEAQKIFHRQAHSLAGTGATFGFAEVSDAARALERAVDAAGGVRNIAASGAITARMAELRSVIINIGERRATDFDGFFLEPRHREDVDQNLIYIVDSDEAFVESLALQIEHYGYDVRRFSDLFKLTDAVLAETPVAIISGVMFPEGGLAGVEVIEEIQAQLDEPVPVYFISLRDDIDARLKSVHAGGLAYFTKPPDVGSIIDRLDMLVTKEPPKPFRVLVVDDEVEMTDYYRVVLESAGMEVAAINNPKQVLVELVGFEPEVVLMDLYMPECTGLELAQMIRQQEAFVGMPIVYLSSEVDRGQQIKAMSVGGDDFLTKPIEPDYLVSALKIRIERARVLRSYMIRDSLTGLLNHTKTMEQLDIEIARALRQNTGLTFAIVDIDKFKLVNDTYGHPTGDRVIKSLSRLLQQRLRKVDIVGRIGGEEFGVLLVDTDAENAVKVLDKLREGYAEVTHQSGSVEFSSSFSCGVAQLSDFGSASDLSDAADRALYLAKKSGRNQVVLAKPD